MPPPIILRYEKIYNLPRAYARKPVAEALKENSGRFKEARALVENI
jgi:hypothetical protein